MLVRFRTKKRRSVIRRVGRRPSLIFELFRNQNKAPTQSNCGENRSKTGRIPRGWLRGTGFLVATLPKRQNSVAIGLLAAFVRALRVGADVLIPGSGGDWRTIRAFCKAEHGVTAIDFSPFAVEQAKDALGQFADTLVLGDFFSYDFGSRRFEIVYERTFLCSLPPRLWKNYVARVAELLQRKGKLAGFFLYGEESDPPPFPLTEAWAKKLFAGRFELIRTEPVADSLPIFRGM